MNNQLNIFDFLYPNYKITKPIRLIELFAGYGSQALALKYLGVNFEHWKISEWAIKSIQAYKDMHFPGKYYWKNIENCGISKEVITDTLYNIGISSNYNNPMSKKEIQRLSYEKLVRIYENILITNNLVNIQNIKGKDLEIEDIEKYDYILTYSFPCQDLSLAGKKAGMSDTTTRSGLLWEVERILTECKELGNLPQILLMENVPQVHNQDNIKDFNKWQLRLEELGYKNYCQDLIATDYGIPQIRNRCFMVSILGDYNYTFPQPIPLKLKLKDLLEDDVDEKYYLSDKMIKYCMNDNNKFPRKERFLQALKNTSENGIATTICTNAGNRPTDNFIKIKNATKKGYAIAKKGDGVYINRPHQKRGVVQRDKIQTLKTNCDDIGVVVGDNNIDNKIQNGLRVRKLAPREVFRLMGVKDEDFEKVKKNQSDNSLYHLAGDSIVTNVLMAIFRQFLI